VTVKSRASSISISGDTFHAKAQSGTQRLIRASWRLSSNLGAFA
jgi:hypothetical protein